MISKQSYFIKDLILLCLMRKIGVSRIESPIEPMISRFAIFSSNQLTICSIAKLSFVDFLSQIIVSTISINFVWFPFENQTTTDKIDCKNPLILKLED